MRKMRVLGGAGTDAPARFRLDPKRRIRIKYDGTALYDERIRIRADNVPARSWDDPVDPTRTVYVAVFWEDLARDDGDGPPCEIDHQCP